MCEDIEDHKFFSMNEFKYSCRTCGLAWRTMCHDNDMRTHMNIYNHLKIGCIFCDYFINKGEDVFQSRRMDFEFFMRRLKVHVDAHIVKNSGRLRTYRCKNCDILVDVKDGGLSFRRDLNSQEITRKSGKRKRNHYWDSTEDDEDDDYDDEDDSFDDSTSTISTLSESTDTESTPYITLSEDESEDSDDVMITSILPEPNLMFISVLDFLELPDNAMSGPDGMVALPVVETETLTDGRESYQDKCKIPVISLETDDSNVTDEGKDDSSSGTIILSDNENNSCCLESSDNIFNKLAYEVRLAKFLKCGTEETEGNPDSGETDVLLEAEPLSTSFDRKKYMFVSADCWNVPEDGVSNIEEDSTLLKVSAGNVGGTCVSLTESTGSFGSWRSPSSSLFSSSSPRPLFSPDTDSDTSEDNVESSGKFGTYGYLTVEAGGRGGQTKRSKESGMFSATEADAESGSDSSVKTQNIHSETETSAPTGTASAEPAMKSPSGGSYQRFINDGYFRKSIVALPRIQICRVRAISPIRYRDPVGEVSSDDDDESHNDDDDDHDESSNDHENIFDHIHNDSCGNVDGCSGMDKVDGYGSENMSRNDNIDGKVNDESGGSDPNVDTHGCVDTETVLSDVTGKADSDSDKVDIGDTRTYSDRVSIILSDVEVDMGNSGSDTDDAGSAIIEVSDTSAESSNDDVMEVVMIE